MSFWIVFCEGCLCVYVFPPFFFFLVMHADYTGSRALCIVKVLFKHCLGDTTNCSVGPLHCSRDPQLLYLEKNFKMGLTVLFTHLKIILLQCFLFLVFSF